MIDTSLVGYWSDDVMYSGAMEANDVTFRPDGTGFTYWARMGSVFKVDRFRWRVDSRGLLSIRLTHLLSGTWRVHDQQVHHRVQIEDEIDTAHHTRYSLGPGHDVFGNPVRTLALDEPILIWAPLFAYRKDSEEDPTVAGAVSFGDPPNQSH